MHVDHGTCFPHGSGYKRDVTAADTPLSFRARALWAVGLLLGVSLGLYALFMAVDYRWNWSGVWNYRAEFVRGWFTTLGVSLAAMLVSVVAGFALMAGRRAAFEPVRMLCGGVVDSNQLSPLSSRRAKW